MFLYGFFDKIEKQKSKITEIIENLSLDDFKFDIGSSKFEISPKDITTTKIRKFDGTIKYEAELQFGKPFDSLNNPKRLFEVNADDFDLFENEFNECGKVEIQYYYIQALFINKEKYNLIKSKLYKLISYDRYYGFLIPMYLKDLLYGFQLIEYNIPYITDTQQFDKEFEIMLFDNLKIYLKEALYNL